MDLSRLAWLFSCVGIAIADVYLMCLWIFAAARTRLLCFTIVACTSSLWALFSIIAALLSLDPSIISFVDPSLYRLFRIWFFAVQPLVTFVSLSGYTLIVRRMLLQEKQATPNA